MTISERGRLNLANKAYDILFNRGDKISMAPTNRGVVPTFDGVGQLEKSFLVMMLGL
jgi:hypothetical protein